MKNRLQKGFSLVEIMVAVAIFSVVISVASMSFILAIKSQKKSLAEQELLAQTSYVMEYMSRALRMAKKDLSGDCIAAKTNYGRPYGNSSIRFLNYEGATGECQEFFLDVDGQLKMRKSSDDTAANFGAAVPLTSATLTIDPGSVQFYLIGESQFDNIQPRVTIFLDIDGKEQTDIKIQTTISQRNLDIEY